MTIRIEYVKGLGPEFERAFRRPIAKFRNLMVQEVRKAAPRRTGKLRRSIQRGRGRIIFRIKAVYGNVLNERGRHRDWIDNAMERARRRFNRSR